LSPVAVLSQFSGATMNLLSCVPLDRGFAYFVDLSVVRLAGSEPIDSLSSFVNRAARRQFPLLLGA